MRGHDREVQPYGDNPTPMPASIPPRPRFTESAFTLEEFPGDTKYPLNGSDMFLLPGRYSASNQFFLKTSNVSHPHFLSSTLSTHCQVHCLLLKIFSRPLQHSGSPPDTWQFSSEPKASRATGGKRDAASHLRPMLGYSCLGGDYMVPRAFIAFPL